MAELADALDLGSSGSRRGGSSPPFRIEQLTDFSGTRSGGPLVKNLVKEVFRNHKSWGEPAVGEVNTT